MTSIQASAKLSGKADSFVFMEALGVASSHQIRKSKFDHNSYEVHTFASSLEGEASISEYVKKSSNQVFAIVWKNLVFHPDVSTLFEQEDHQQNYQKCISDKMSPRNDPHHPQHKSAKRSSRRRYLHCNFHNQSLVAEHWGHVRFLQGRVYDQKIAREMDISPEALIVEKK